MRKFLKWAIAAAASLAAGVFVFRRVKHHKEEKALAEGTFPQVPKAA